MTIYQPAEDSYLLKETLKNHLKDKPRTLKILDMGSGSGIQAETCKSLKFNNITTADINPEAIKLLRNKNLNPIQSDLFQNIKERYDLIIFNPPYLPEDEREPVDSRLSTTAGKEGYEIIIKFLEQATKHLEQKGTILLLFSNLSKPEIILKRADELGFKYKKLAEKSLPFFEILYVYELYL